MYIVTECSQVFTVLPVYKWEHYIGGKYKVYTTEDNFKYKKNYKFEIVDTVYKTKIEALTAAKEHLLEILFEETYYKLIDFEAVEAEKEQKLNQYEENVNKYIIQPSFKFPFGKYKNMTAEQIINADHKKGYEYICWFVDEVGATLPLNYNSELRQKIWGNNSQLAWPNDHKPDQHWDAHEQDMFGPEPY